MADMGALSRRLRALRESRKLKQRELGAVLRPERPVSDALISAWESERAPALPSESWLSSYARLFSPDWDTRRSAPRLLDDGELTHAEKEELSTLEAELHALRRRAAQGGRAEDVSPNTGALGGRFWHFADEKPVMIIGSALPDEELRWFPYADRRHPDYMHLVRHADSGAVVELFGHLRAENPTSDVRFKTSNANLSEDELSGHVVVLGGQDLNPYPLWFAERRDDFDEFPRAGHIDETPRGRRFVTGPQNVPLDGDFGPTFAREPVVSRRLVPGAPDRPGPSTFVENSRKFQNSSTTLR